MYQFAGWGLISFFVLSFLMCLFGSSKGKQDPGTEKLGMLIALATALWIFRALTMQ